MATETEPGMICIEPEGQGDENWNLVYLQPGELYTLVTSVKTRAEKGISILPDDGSLLRHSQPLSQHIPGWSTSSMVRGENGWERKIYWFGREEDKDITSLSVSFDKRGGVDFLELATMNSNYEVLQPIPYLRGFPCMDPREVIRATEAHEPTEDQKRSLGEFVLIPEVPAEIKNIVASMAWATEFTVMRIIQPEISADGQSLLRVQKHLPATTSYEA